MTTTDPSAHPPHRDPRAAGVPPTPTDPPETTRVLMGGLIDYAGLFPPAKLGMAQAVANYERYLRSPDAWMLGRFILPVSRLAEFRTAAAGLLPTVLAEQGLPHEQPWLISAIIDGDLDRDLDEIFAFNHHHTAQINGLALVDAVEARVPYESGNAHSSTNFIDHAIESMPEELYAFFEIPSALLPDCRGLIAALAGADAAAKIRTGGVTPDAFPPPDAVASFLAACAAADVPFKATAGLHHAVRAHYPLTYEPACPRGLMHGFLNVFVAAALVRTHGITPSVAAEVLETTDPRAFQFGTTVLSWRSPTRGSYGLTIEQLAQTRETFALSYGSCSFEEPTGELRALGAM